MQRSLTFKITLPDQRPFFYVLRMPTIRAAKAKIKSIWPDVRVIDHVASRGR